MLAGDDRATNDRTMGSGKWEAFRRGERTAVERVYRDHVDQVEQVVRLGLQKAGRLSAANLADVVQEVFTKAFSDRARESFDGSREYAPFLLRIAKNALVDWLRRGGREVSLSEPDAFFELDASSAGSEDGAPFDAELLAATARYVENLSPELRAAHHRRFVLTEPQERAAEALGITRQQLRTLERRIVDGLRVELRRAKLRDYHRGSSGALLASGQTVGRS